MNYLGIDYGQKHVGLALATTILAEPLEATTIEHAPKKIAELIKAHKIDQILIGEPDESMNTQIQDFIKSLNLSIPVNIVDETLSSYDAREALAHTTQTKRRNNEHSVAAAILLQSWLDGLEN